MEKAEICKIMKFYKNINPQSKLNDNDPEIISLWLEMFGDYTYEQVKNAIVTYAKKKPFAPSLGEIVSLISVYEIERLEPNTLIIRYEDEEYGCFPFRFESKEIANSYSKLFKKCNYDKDMIRAYHQEYTRSRNDARLIVPVQENQYRKYEGR